MKWYYPPRLGADLSEGFESFDKLDEGASAEHIDSLLQTIIAHEQRIGKKIDAHVVTWRGIVTKVRFSILDMPTSSQACHEALADEEY